MSKPGANSLAVAATLADSSQRIIGLSSLTTNRLYMLPFDKRAGQQRALKVEDEFVELNGATDILHVNWRVQFT